MVTRRAHPAVPLFLVLAVACGGKDVPAVPAEEAPIIADQPVVTSGQLDEDSTLGAEERPEAVGLSPEGHPSPDDGSPSTSSPVTEIVPIDDRCVSDPSPQFTHAYTDLDQIEFINPTIVTSGNWLKNRQYHKIVTDADNRAPLVPVYAPLDATAVGITHYIGTMQSWEGEILELSQFYIRFEVSCEVAFWFDHLSELVGPFAAVTPEDPVRDTRDAEVPIQIEVQGGDLVGYTSGTEPAHTWDFVLVNDSNTVQFANQARYEQSADLEHLLRAACPFDYYDEPLRSQFRSKFGSWQGHVDDSDCDFEVDVVGSIAGGWFLTPFDPAGGFAPIDWGFVVKTGADGAVDLNGPQSSIRTLLESPTFADPQTVTGEHCYEDYHREIRYVYVRVLSDSEVAAAFGDGVCPASLPANHQVFHR